MKQAYQLEGQNNLRDWIFHYAAEYDYEWHLRHYDGEDLPEEFKFISHYHSIASTYMEMEWICANDTDRRTPEEMARTITEARRISMSDTYFGPNNRIYELRITGRIGITIKKRSAFRNSLNDRKKSDCQKVIGLFLSFSYF